MVFNMCFPKSGASSLTRSTGEDSRRNMEIEKMIRKDKKNQARQVKILLLGAGESGKSTILKQMRIIYSEGFRLDERKEVRQVIFSNMIVAFKIIAEEMRELGLEYENSQSHVRHTSRAKGCNALMITQDYEAVIGAASDIGPDDPFPLQCLPAMKGLWKDDAVQQCIKRGNEYALHDNIQ